MSLHTFTLQSIRPFFFRHVSGSVLEIGPLDRPVIRGAKYFDVSPTDELREYAAKVGRDPNNVPHIDYYSAGGDLSVINETFDSVVSCHAIEHQPDVIRHLSQVRNLLTPGGAYFLVVPDRRYCFDYYIPESTEEEMRAAQGNTVHTLENLVRHATQVTHNRSYLHWLGFHGKRMDGKAKEVRAAEMKAQHAKGGYIDTHAWQFTPDSFAYCIEAVEELTGLRVERVNGTFPGLQEFTAVLRRTL